MREIRPSGSEGGVALRRHPYPYGPRVSAEARTMGQATYLRSRKKPLASARSSVTLLASTPGTGIQAGESSRGVCSRV